MLDLLHEVLAEPLLLSSNYLSVAIFIIQNFHLLLSTKYYGHVETANLQF